MIERRLETEVCERLEETPVVALLGPRQVGKTTLAHRIAEMQQPRPLYLDLEDPRAQAQLADPSDFFARQGGRLIILDEIHRLPNIFSILRGVIDRRRRMGEHANQFLILGSASLELLQQASESLAGRIAYTELSGIDVLEALRDSAMTCERLWWRGGFPGSLLAPSDRASSRWRQSFIRSYLERDIPQMGPRLPATLLRRLWTMLAHHQGGLLNTSQLAVSLDLSPRTTRRYVELLADLLLVRVLQPWFGNVARRLVKTPKVYIRDSGLLHALLAIPRLDDLLAHPVCGASWEGFVLENLHACLPPDGTPWFFRTQAGAEVDLVVEQGVHRRIAIEIKRSTTPKLSRGFYAACDDLKATDRFVVYGGDTRFKLASDVEAMPIAEMMAWLRKLP